MLLSCEMVGTSGELVSFSLLFAARRMLPPLSDMRAITLDRDEDIIVKINT
jgi:hypothetical protein